MKQSIVVELRAAVDDRLCCDIINWLNHNIGEYLVDWDRWYDWSPGCWSFSFVRATDAILFKLTWGGA